MTTSRDDIIKLAKECGFFQPQAITVPCLLCDATQLEAFFHAAQDELRADLSQALCDDCENGVKWLNERAVEKFKQDFPNLDQAIRNRSNKNVE